MEAYRKALAIKPDFAEAYNNLGVIFQDQGKLEEAIEAYNKAISIKPDYAKAHRHLSRIKEYTPDDPQFLEVKSLLNKQDINDDARSKLNFALAKMYEDMDLLDLAFTHLSEGNALRKRVLKYSIDQDKKLFEQLKKTQPLLFKNSLKRQKTPTELTPIFILGMPRSGTTLVEQIISSHSKVTGAGELKYLSQYGAALAVGTKTLSEINVSEFRKHYLAAISKEANNIPFITDKMPHNFRFIPLICAALPEAKIIHVKRDPAATCWSNYKQYFATKSLGYCYNIDDVLTYFGLYSDLMQFWQNSYNNEIYNLDYENLTTDQENETKKLIQHLNLKWENACLAPHKNKRSVRTASQQQVTQKLYQGSSNAWKKYEKFLDGAFHSLSPQ
jgi:tetratricopeptide (TPR) repeat protein